MPKGVIEVRIPVSEDIEFELAPLGSTPDDTNRFQRELERRNAVEKISENRELGLGIPEMQYRAQWAINDFLREYTRSTGHYLVEPFSVHSFWDGVNFRFIKNSKEQNEVAFRVSSVRSFNSTSVEPQVQTEIQSGLLQGVSSSLRQLTCFHLERLEYHPAVIGMYQEFEKAWNISDDPGSKWSFIERSTSDQNLRQSLGEMINARNHVVHQSTLKLEDAPPRNPLRYGSVPLSQFEIYALKKPWAWHQAVRRFLDGLSTGVSQV